MHHKLGTFVAAAALISLGAGCVERTKYDALQAKFKERDAEIQAREAELVEARNRETFAVAERSAIEKEIALLKARIEAKEIEASVKVSGPAVESTAFAAAPREDGEPVAPPGEGWRTTFGPLLEEA